MAIVRKRFLGKVVRYASLIKPQKIGLSHLHVLLILESAFKPTKIGHYDKLACVELLDKTLFLELHEIVGQCVP